MRKWNPRTYKWSKKREGDAHELHQKLMTAKLHEKNNHIMILGTNVDFTDQGWIWRLGGLRFNLNHFRISVSIFGCCIRRSPGARYIILSYVGFVWSFILCGMAFLPFKNVPFSQWLISMAAAYIMAFHFYHETWTSHAKDFYDDVVVSSARPDRHHMCLDNSLFYLFKEYALILGWLFHRGVWCRYNIGALD